MPFAHVAFCGHGAKTLPLLPHWAAWWSRKPSCKHDFLVDVCSGMDFWLCLCLRQGLFVVGFLGVFVLVFVGVGVFVSVFVGGFLDVFVDGFVGVFVDVFVGVFVGGFVGVFVGGLCRPCGQSWAAIHEPSKNRPEKSPPKAFQQLCEIDASRFVDASVCCGVLLETPG